MEKLSWKRSFQLNFVRDKKFNLITVVAIAIGVIIYALFGDWIVLIMAGSLSGIIRIRSFLDCIGTYLCSCGRQIVSGERYCSRCGTEVPRETRNKRAE